MSLAEPPVLQAVPRSPFRYVAAGILVVSQIVFAIPLLAWPFVLLASVMSLAGHRAGNEDPRVVGVALAFCVSAVAYPAPYLLGLMLSWWSFRRQRHGLALLFGLIAPLIFGFVVLLGWAWATVGQ